MALLDCIGIVCHGISTVRVLWGCAKGDVKKWNIRAEGRSLIAAPYLYPLFYTL